jgi:hypothetical protein
MIALLAAVSMNPDASQLPGGQVLQNNITNVSEFIGPHAFEAPEACIGSFVGR